MILAKRYNSFFRLGKDSQGSGTLLFVSEDILSKPLKVKPSLKGSVYVKINLRIEN